MKKIFTAILLTVMSLTAMAATVAITAQTTTILNAVGTTGAGVNSYQFKTYAPPIRYVQATLNGASAVSATAVLQCSSDNTAWVDAATIGLTLAAPTDGSSLNTACPFVRGNVTAISGTGETVTMTISQ